MYTTKREQQRLRFQNHAKKPSFSSILLDQIYRSIDEGNDMKLYNETMAKQQNRVFVEEEEEEEEITAASIRRACLLDKWKESEKAGSQWKTQTEGKSRWHHHHNHEHDQEVMFFSSTSSSSDSSSGLLSSSDTESLYGMRSKSRVSCFAPSRPKPVVTSASNEVGLIKSESRALKIYNNLKKVKQPISPGGKLSNFLNSLFATGGSVKKTKTYDDDAKASTKSGQDSTCSSASSFSRSCLSKASTSSKDKLRDGVKRTVRFYPVSVIVGEDSRACGHKCLYEEDTRVTEVSVPTAWKIGRKKNQEDEELRVVDRSRRVEEAAREFLKEYHRSQKKSDFTNLDVEDDGDASSCSSSDLFELDHLAVMGNDRYGDELPVYETTYVSTNRAIANGLI
ncbi:hypothetical protein AAZX31_04G053800 [Glycine max]|uniref:Protein BIG GRAIN 1-like A n=1 Tax=Glycine max TaxID=3847 RepID=K7KI94_SOYBN|nr:protein BIG GRAIN 1-like A [Glycine max]KAG5048302.1 hypothetical protein JHK85_009405 [Glycine max]KAG5065419.1 hypothetical protein JHK86_009150 [Glycine max]KAH1109927.1 hypothetical protein GYH30_009031 [Glycine max]KAH1252669.1 Protein BIG GRAIN 1-like B [Glycine max]KRH61567.1 hypothetical protein GLYMA_04G055100v4 [Glycine max]|eukprot:XP_003523651.1 protein BIG GRAIN 1-like A [Glycine max]